MFAFSTPRQPRKPSLTPMIDVVFLLLVFFMLAARFGQDMALDLNIATTGNTPWQGAPRLIEIHPQTLTLNGVPLSEEILAETLRSLMPGPDAPVLLRAGPATDLTRMVAIIDVLRVQGIAQLVVVQ